MATSKRFASLLVVLALAGTLAACGSSSSKSSSKTTTTKKAAATTTTKATVSTADAATLATDIKTAFDAYLAAPDVNSQLSYVDKGQTLLAVQTKLNAATAGLKIAVQVTNVKVTPDPGGKTAKFTYDLADGKDITKVLLGGQSGGVVLQSDGKYLLDRNTICDLGSAGAPQYADECLTAAAS
ncbi:MAG: hypothetical protein JWL73_1717 [Actinomycetia bacterium]|nr:hypothetical protein [Actinomycetes bacterium]